MRAAVGKGLRWGGTLGRYVCPNYPLPLCAGSAISQSSRTLHPCAAAVSTLMQEPLSLLSKPCCLVCKTHKTAYQVPGPPHPYHTWMRALHHNWCCCCLSVLLVLPPLLHGLLLVSITRRQLSSPPLLAQRTGRPLFALTT